MKNKKELINRSYNFEVRATEDEKGKVIEGRPNCLWLYDRFRLL